MFDKGAEQPQQKADPTQVGLCAAPCSLSAFGSWCAFRLLPFLECREKAAGQRRVQRVRDSPVGTRGWPPAPHPAGPRERCGWVGDAAGHRSAGTRHCWCVTVTVTAQRCHCPTLSLPTAQRCHCPCPAVSLSLPSNVPAQWCPCPAVSQSLPSGFPLPAQQCPCPAVSLPSGVPVPAQQPGQAAALQLPMRTVRVIKRVLHAAGSAARSCCALQRCLPAPRPV